MLYLVRTPFTLLGAWSRQSVAGARRNAMTATTACAARRQERLEVNEFIRTCLARRVV